MTSMAAPPTITVTVRTKLRLWDALKLRLAGIGALSKLAVVTRKRGKNKRKGA